ncbi:MAG: M23 family metallopeptidase [Candidatus Gracilibacteria bacterium]|jgi:murein DD-endopeptidase MepM/ murein hydrolase activator NlpD
MKKTMYILAVTLIAVLAVSCSYSEKSTEPASDAATNTETSALSVPDDSQGFIRPTEGLLTQGYHDGHLAVDIAKKDESGVGVSTPILAVKNGTVIEVSTGTYGGGYGNHITLDHGNGVQTFYAHCAEVYVEVGDAVSQGQVIANTGNTGRVYGVTGIHLHFELIVNGEKVNPFDYFGGAL